MPSGGARNKRLIKVIELDEIYESQIECAHTLGLNVAAINNCLRGKQKKHKGLHFEYVDVYEVNIREEFG